MDICQHIYISLLSGPAVGMSSVVKTSRVYDTPILEVEVVALFSAPGFCCCILPGPDIFAAPVSDLDTWGYTCSAAFNHFGGFSARLT